jgi:hypothetical protein
VLAVALFVVANAATPPPPPNVPVYVPRYAAVATIINPASVVAITPRIGWEVELIAQPRNWLLFQIELGFAYALSTPAGVGLFWEHVALFGIGYQMTRDNGFHWGLNAGFGPVLWGNRGDVSEQRVGPYVEGRVHFGWKLDWATISITGGWGQPMSNDYGSHAQLYVGGFFLGAMFGWR